MQEKVPSWLVVIVDSNLWTYPPIYLLEKSCKVCVVSYSVIKNTLTLRKMHSILEWNQRERH